MTGVHDTEPSAVAPDAKVNWLNRRILGVRSNFSESSFAERYHPKLTLASGATALGSVTGSVLQLTDHNW